MSKRPLQLSVGERAQLKIAKQSLRMDPQFARWMGMSHDQAREIVRNLTGNAKSMPDYPLAADRNTGAPTVKEERIEYVSNSIDVVDQEAFFTI